ncbi:MAG: symmetrical bis(5'-nucleosyl)-tetraphosphatase [Gammaproteobacteria bacterium]|nr:symmetrical bis(5'-nucleosyl)-tetraphosphatase [Gammaproteobacteria bacterium]MCW8927759.1 symmetrical bis(5'-nucleosyl)-tetraphosphatase [Gammaproteobacteria bacterium]MCW8959806.1 symmetrical bis(5'-nucleosyl)-tetraphosphatase [Gammaproteobacteria bacterium]MCW8971867.1 symmetrical bis(5'-nucleosyl)-tetraphosphatase [Gammaproteobacteria bacterium]MCW8994130.1 symmetrical bis(5'-nucleosyl)-tetraphosphatase [Gammaproteobacteria bacterium]
MATYAIGDIQGCFDELQQLLQQLNFDPVMDRLWFTGDLVNRGPKSLETLRFVRALGDSAITVLGNHDLHLLAVWQNRQRHLKSNDSLAAIFRADDGDELMEWLRQCPLMHFDAGMNMAMVHAGLPPQWDRDQALACATEVEAVLRGPKFHEFLGHMYGNKPALWSDNLSGWDRMRFIVNCFTRLRFCTHDGKLDFLHKGIPGSGEHDYLPWFALPQRKSRDLPIVFGHWSTLGLYQQDNVHAIDTGCLWGGRLTALELESGSVHSLPCNGYAQPG